MSCDVVVRVAGADDAPAVATLRSLWSTGEPSDADFDREMAAWLALEGERRFVWLATVDGGPVGMATMLEYRRMPRPGRLDSRWGYVGNMFVREDARNRGIGSALLAAIVAAADVRGYARLVLSPSPRAVPFYERAGFVVPDAAAGGHRLMVRPGTA
jgi:GNAT superfamily N-acetyltransferase